MTIKTFLSNKAYSTCPSPSFIAVRRNSPPFLTQKGTSARDLPSFLEDAKTAAVRRSFGPVTVRRAAPRAGLAVARTSVGDRGHSSSDPPAATEVLSPRLTIPSFFEQPPTPDIPGTRRLADAAPNEDVRSAVAKAEGGECGEAAFSSVLSVRSLLQVEDPDVSNRQPDDREGEARERRKSSQL
ncbi:hypothetical protein MRX96_035084 [Rhipicephalus microplus]